MHQSASTLGLFVLVICDTEDGVAVGGDGGAVVGDDDDGGIGTAVGEPLHQGGGCGGIEGAVELVE